jgi:hypothetical protein
MKRHTNLRLWVGFILVVAGIAGYPTLFIRFPLTRDFPWATLLLFALGAGLLAVGLLRAFTQPHAYRGKIAGSILASISVLMIGFFLAEWFYVARRLPASRGTPQVSESARDFTLPDSTGRPVTLSGLLNSSFGSNNWPDSALPSGKTAGVVLIFYRGYW